MQESYDTIAGGATAEFVEKRSRFIGGIAPVKTPGEAMAFLEAVRSRHRDARHNCYAYLLREGGAQRYSDDGEPQGTAGIPMLEVLRREGLSDLMVVVTRYFGGILLGAGGLVRAYSHTAKLAVDAATRVTMCRTARISLRCPYALYEQVRLLLEGSGALVLDTAFEADVRLVARLAAGELEPFSLRLGELSAGALSPVVECHEFAPI